MCQSAGAATDLLELLQLLQKLFVASAGAVLVFAEAIAVFVGAVVAFAGAVFGVFD